MTGNLAFLSGGGDMGAIIRAHDWSANPLGPPATWSPALRTMVSLVINTSLLGTLMWGPELRLIYNDAYAPALGHRRPGALGAPIREVWGDVWDRLAPSFLPVWKTGISVFEKRFPLPMERDGRQVLTYWDYSVTAVRDGEGRIVGLLNHALDVTREVNNEEALLRAQENLRRANLGLQVEVETRTNERDRMWALAQELLLVIAPDGLIQDVNPLWNDLLGRPKPELVGTKLTAWVHPEDRMAATAMLAFVRVKAVTAPVELRLRHRDGSYRTFAWVGAFDQGRTYAAGRDITLEKQQLESLRQSQKMEAVGQLTGGLAHDFNNLLGGISGALEMTALRAQQGRLADIDAFVASGMGAVRRAAALTHRLLAFSRKQSLAPKRSDMRQLVDGMLDLIGRTVGPGIVVHRQPEPSLWTVLVDPSQLENALLNLCINARDAMPHGGRITIGTRDHHADAAEAEREGCAAGQYVALSVADTGTGMAAEVMARAFDPFFTTKDVGQGTGLGLSMIYGFAKQSGGWVHIASQPDAGTTVTIYLPRHWGEPDAEWSDASAPMPASQSTGETVFVVDDEPTVRLLVTSVLEESGYTVVEASDSAGGLRVLESDARIDLLVTDIGLPGGMNGKEMADLAQRRRPALKVLFITGYAEAFQSSEAPLSGQCAVLAKPFALDALRKTVADLLRTPGTVSE